MSAKEKIAKLIRFITVPPMMALLLLVVLYGCKEGIFNDVQEFIVSLFLLVLFPLTAYPLQKIIPAYKNQGRNGQRKLAFIFNFLSYSILMIYGFIKKVSMDLMILFGTYFLTVFILTVFNKLLKVRASGHAASCTSPLIFIMYFFSWRMLLPCSLVFILIFWASVVLKRHTPKEFLIGALSCLFSFAGAVVWL